ncbi:spermine/spermidine synthase domain-containing protein [Helicobacter bizzozeronii]|uniref:spermine/spermidine synthase domain-containing protein n=1 Tax=Helicobacter bizzozeronii TaxID=56877 RepID=UPI000CF11A64|nr:spermidine synthase [Helicobacter bizzozeronii]
MQLGSKIQQVKGAACSLEIFESPTLGLVAKVLGAQEEVFLQKYPFLQSEFLAHVGGGVLPEIQHALVVGGFDLEVAFELSGHAQSVAFIQEESKILQALKPFFPHFQEVIAHANFKHHAKMIDLEIQKYDLIIDLHTPNAHQIDGLQRMLSPQGILLLRAPHPLLDPQGFKSTLEHLQGYFSVLMPCTNPYDVRPLCYLFASKHHHPEADLLLQKVDMLEGLQHYNAQVHTSAFSQPNWLKSAYLGLLKN